MSFKDKKNKIFRFIENDLTKKEIAEKTHIFSTYFMTKLLPSETESELSHEELINMINKKYYEMKNVLNIMKTQGLIT